MTLHERELDLRLRRYLWLRSALLDDQPTVDDLTTRHERRLQHRSDLLDAAHGFTTTGDVGLLDEALRALVSDAGADDVWPGVTKGVLGFLEAMIGDGSGTAELAVSLAELVIPPDDDGVDALIRLIDLVELSPLAVRPPAHHAVAFLSLWWWVADPDHWPYARPDALDGMRRSGWLDPGSPPEEQYWTYRETWLALGANHLVDDTMEWSRTAPWMGLDPMIRVRLEWAEGMADQWEYDRYRDRLEPVALANIAAVRSDLRTLGDLVRDEVAANLGRSVRTKISHPRDDNGMVGSTAWIRWHVTDTAVGDGTTVDSWKRTPSLQVQLDPTATVIGVDPGRRGPRWLPTVRSDLSNSIGGDLSVIDTDDGFVIGVAHPGDEMFATTDITDEIIRVAAALQPLLHRMLTLAAQMDDDPFDPDEEGLEDRLDQVVESCHLEDRSFVDEVLELLADKGQVVFYGPPGTGKTFIAKQLARAIAPDPELRRVVQFHPSTSYEDFFEGYRPSTDASGNLSYSLTRGPLAELAEHAEHDPRSHVLVIDELNRANIPKVLGELLFLLEYRDETIVPLYRPEGFRLPPNLWVLATMNTADRSIATIDAALRRRFHFVPIFPDRWPIEGLLARHLERHDRDPGWADLVDMVNVGLRDQLGSSDLLIGPSHFMGRDLDEATMARIWRHDVEPFLEDQFFGDPATVESFRWKQVLARHRRSTRDRRAVTAADIGETSADTAVTADTADATAVIDDAGVSHADIQGP